MPEETDEYSGSQDQNEILKGIWKELRLIRRALEGNNPSQGRETIHADRPPKKKIAT
jgi:hypothetical protein